jgi:hypothetical protein
MGWLFRIFRRPKARQRAREDASHVNDAIKEARRVRGEMDAQTNARRHEVAANRLEQMRIRQHLRSSADFANVLNVPPVWEAARPDRREP